MDESDDRRKRMATNWRGDGRCKAKDDDDEYFVRCVDLSLSYHLIDDVH